MARTFFFCIKYSKKTPFAIAMIKTTTILFLALIAQSSLVAQEAATISSAEITFVYRSNDTDGSISGFSSSSSIVLDDPSNSVFEGEVQANTIETGNFLRNWSLRGSKYFDVEKFPKIKFASTKVTLTDGGYAVEGNLTIKDTTKPITIKFTKNGKTLTGTTTLFSSDYGINVKKKREDNKVSVKMVFVLQ